uniref:Uncharacterized protein n=1 Tax=Triticum urartu TaxID=4572 RepID=A0A8R7TZH7_TRIUA
MADGGVRSILHHRSASSPFLRMPELLPVSWLGGLVLAATASRSSLHLPATSPPPLHRPTPQLQTHMCLWMFSVIFCTQGVCVFV